jgi:malate permease and related proteins
MSAFILLAACLLLGWIAAHIGNPPPTLGKALNWWVINVALSALVLRLVPTLEFSIDFWFLVASMWFVFLGAWGFFALLGRALNWSSSRVGSLTLVCGLGNTSFIGFPFIEALRGADSLRLALIADQAGCFLALAIGGTVVASVHGDGKAEAAQIARKILTFPPFISLVLAVIVGAFGSWPATMEPVLDRIGATLVPLALFSVGLQFRVRFEASQVVPIALGLSWKLLLAPAIVCFLGTFLQISRPILTVAVLESAMAPMISAAILAEQNQLEPSLANTLLGFGIVLSFLTVPLANALL